MALSMGSSPVFPKAAHAAVLVIMLLLVAYIAGMVDVMLDSLAVEIVVYLVMPYVAAMGITLQLEAHVVPIMFFALRDGLVVELLTVILMVTRAAVTIAMQNQEANVVRKVDHVRVDIIAWLSMESVDVVQMVRLAQSPTRSQQLQQSLKLPPQFKLRRQPRL